MINVRKLCHMEKFLHMRNVETNLSNGKFPHMRKVEKIYHMEKFLHMRDVEKICQVEKFSSVIKKLREEQTSLPFLF